MVDSERPDGRYSGWADRVAHGFAQDRAPAGDAVEYANLAIRGKLLDQVVAEQLEPAVALGPTLVTFHAGPNDVLRPGTDLASLYVRYDRAVARLAATGADILLFTSPSRSAITSRFTGRLQRRFEGFNANVRSVARRRGCHLVDLQALPVLGDHRFWGVDRLHLNDQGHVRVAAAVLAELGVTDEHVLGGRPGWWEEPLPPAERAAPREVAAAEARWLREHLLPWVGRRLRGVSSGDHLHPKDPALRPVDP